jgi:hypothetical protein
MHAIHLCILLRLQISLEHFAKYAGGVEVVLEQTTVSSSFEEDSSSSDECGDCAFNVDLNALLLLPSLAPPTSARALTWDVEVFAVASSF